MDIPLLEKAGISLFGNQWQSDLARELEVSPRTVRHWAQTGLVPARRWQNIRDMCLARQGTLHSVIAQIDEAVSRG